MRTEPEIMDDICFIYGMLSPENLTGDGEFSRTEVAKRRAQFNARLRELEKELGRKVTEEEAYGLPIPAPVPRLAPAKLSVWKKGDRVQFKDQNGKIIIGVVRTVNIKSITIDPVGATNGRYWRVGPSLLSKAV